VEKYDAGFASQGIYTKGKLPTTWGRMKSERALSVLLAPMPTGVGAFLLKKYACKNVSNPA